MVEKETPTYRKLQAQMTSDRIVAAARSLMSERGWAASTISAIAQEAGVSTPTIYAVFGNKRGLLAGMREVMQRDSEIPELMAAAGREPDPAVRLRLWALLIRQQMQTSYDVIAIHREAARSDSEVAVAYRLVLDSRAETFRTFIRGIGQRLPKEIDEQTAVDLLWAFSNEELWRELTEERGWSPDRFEAWLGATLIAQILIQPATSGRRARSSPPSA